MSTKASFGYHSGEDGKPPYHLYEDFHGPGMVFVELPRECLDEMDGGTITLRLTPELWEAIRQHACPNSVPKDFWENYKLDTEALKAFPKFKPESPS